MLVMGFVVQCRQHHDLKVAQAGVGMVARMADVVLFVHWILANLAGADDGLSNSLIAFFSISLVLGSAIVDTVLE